MSRPVTPTLNSHLSSARLCQANGWVVGDVLHAPALEKEGDRMNRVIRIAAIGEQAILAREWEWVTGNWSDELGYSLVTRAWRPEVERERALRSAGRGVPEQRRQASGFRLQATGFRPQEADFGPRNLTPEACSLQPDHHGGTHAREGTPLPADAPPENENASG